MKIQFTNNNVLPEHHKYNVAYALAHVAGNDQNDEEGILIVPVCTIHTDSLEDLRSQLHRDVDNFIDLGLKNNSVPEVQ